MQYIVELTSMAFGGEAVGRVDEGAAAGKVIFVPRGAPGDRARVEVTKDRASFLRGQIVELLTPGAGRREPSCPLFGQCGGCQWQHLSYPCQLSAKAEIISRALASRGADVLPLVDAPAEWGYRRRVRFGWRRDRAGRLTIGFRRWRSRLLLDVQDCPLLVPGLVQALQLFRRRCRALLPGGSEGSLSLVASERGEVHASLRCRRARLRSPAELASSLLRQPVVGAVVAAAGVAPVEAGKTSVLLRDDREPRQIARGAATAFAQPNPAQERRLCAQVERWAGRGARTLELHAGVGTFTQQLSRNSERVVAVESSPAAADLFAQNLAAQIEAGRVSLIPSEVQEVLSELQGERFDTLVVDPPRQGCRELPRVLEAVRPSRVVYVSCDPMTLARDLEAVAPLGFRTTSARGYDMMPQTFHVEVVAMLEKRDG